MAEAISDNVNTLSGKSTELELFDLIMSVNYLIIVCEIRRQSMIKNEVLDVIDKRISLRAYSGQPISSEEENAIREFDSTKR